MGTKTTERRKKYFINRQFQAKFILKFCGLVIAGAFLFGAIVLLMSRKTVTTAFENAHLTIKSTADFIFPALLVGSAVVIVAVGLATIVITLFTSHKIVGPLYRMEKDIQEVTGGNLNKQFKLRYSDELKALAQSLDAMVQSMKEKMTAINTATAGVEEVLKKYASKEQFEKLKEALEKFNC